MIEIPALYDFIESGEGIVLIHGWDRVKHINPHTGRTLLVDRLREERLSVYDFDESNRPLPPVFSGGTKISYKAGLTSTDGDLLLVPQDVL